MAAIPKYSVLRFRSVDEAQAFTEAVLGFVGSQEGVQWMLDTPQRVVMWQPFHFSPGATFREDAATLYVSDGVLELTPTLGLSATVESTMPRDQLPAARALLIGLQTDWHD